MRAAAETTIGLDVGGTRIRAGRVRRDGRIEAHDDGSVRRDRDGFVGQVLERIGEMRRAGTVAVGVGLPGRIDADAGLVRSAGYLDIAGLDLPGIIAAQTGLPARIENDATMAAMAEVGTRGGASGLVAMVTVGTGIGGALLRDGAPWYGGGLAGQFGHLTVADDGPTCNCGRRGCVETLSSGTALARLIADAGLPSGTRVEDLLDAADRGEGIPSRLLAEWARPFRCALETLSAAVDPGFILLGGGLGQGMGRALALLPERSSWFAPTVEPASLGDAAGVIGAGLRAFGTVGIARVETAP